MAFARIALAVALPLASAAPADAKELWETPWIEVRTPHFVIASAQGEEKTRALAVELEDFRAAAELVTNIGRFEERIPTKVYALPRVERELGFEGGAVGLFMPAMRANYALITPQGAESDEVLKHEYMHFLIHNRDALVYPPWLDEGFAELLSTLRVKEDGTLIEFGDFLSWRAESLVYGGWISYDTVLETRDTASLGRSRGGMFYAQSWLLVHYLVIGRTGRSFAVDTSKYLAAVESGTPVGQAFEAAYGLAADAITRTLRSYMRKAKYFRTRLKQPLPRVEVSVSPMPPDAIAAELGVISITRGALPAARKYFEAASAANPDNALALVGIGDLHKLDGRFAEAVAHYEKAIALEPDDANHELDYGEYFLHRARLEKDPALRKGYAIEARRHFARSYKLNPDNPETLDQNGLSYLVEGDDPAKAVESLAVAHDLLPSQSRIRFDLAQAHVAAGQLDEARPHVQRLLAWSHSVSSGALQALLDAIEKAERAAGGPAESESATTTGAASP